MRESDLEDLVGVFDGHDLHLLAYEGRDVLDVLLVLFGDDHGGDATLLRRRRADARARAAKAAEGAAKLLLAGRPLSVDDAEAQEAKVGASLLRAFLACEHDNDEDDDDDDMAAALGGKRRLQQVLSVFFPTLASTRPVSVSRSIATALDDASTPQQAASYVASLPGQQFAAPYALCASVLAGTSLRRGEALTTMRAPDDQGVLCTCTPSTRRRLLADDDLAGWASELCDVTRLANGGLERREEPLVQGLDDGAPLLNAAPNPGAHGCKVAFLHPKYLGGRARRARRRPARLDHPTSRSKS